MKVVIVNGPNKDEIHVTRDVVNEIKELYKKQTGANDPSDEVIIAALELSIIVNKLTPTQYTIDSYLDDIFVSTAIDAIAGIYNGSDWT